MLTEQLGRERSLRQVPGGEWSASVVGLAVMQLQQMFNVETLLGDWKSECESLLYICSTY